MFPHPVNAPNRTGRADCTVWWSTPVRGAASAAELLDDSERRRCMQYVEAMDRARFVTGRLLARRAVAAELAIDPRDVRFAVRCKVCGAAHGKPQVTGPGAVLDLSIAHAHERVVVAVARDCAVGIDVERIGPFDDLTGAAAGVLGDEERAVLSALPQGERPGAFFCYWTRKEALLKATGDGLTIPLATVRVSAPDSPAALVSGPGPLATERVWMSDLDAGPRYAACLALLHTPTAPVAEPRIDHVRVRARELAHAAHSSA